MKRRSAIKNIGMTFGYAIAAPTALSILQSCKEKMAYADWVPGFFDKGTGHALAMMSDIILPKTDTPSATEMNVHVFIDEFIDKVYTLEHKEFVKLGADKFFNQLLSDSGNDTLMDLKAEDFLPLVQKYLAKRTTEKEEAHNKAIGEYFMAKENGEMAEIDDEIAKYSFATGVRDLATFGYKNSEFVGEEVLAYLPIPGGYVGCGDVDELTGGKAWSL